MEDTSDLSNYWNRFESTGQLNVRTSGRLVTWFAFYPVVCTALT